MRPLASGHVVALRPRGRRAFRPIIEAVMPRDKDLASQMRRAVTSAPLNTAEGNRRIGGDRVHAFRVAAGEAEEALTGARAAFALGYID
jgi:four helix bundle protein